jgi:hypothetical protein
MSGDKRITYTVEDKTYDPDLFTDEGKVLFKQVVELGAEMEILHKKIAVLQAASITFNAKLKETLTTDMELTTLASEVADSTTPFMES